jgi:hypothetical protein
MGEKGASNTSLGCFPPETWLLLACSSGQGADASATAALSRMELPGPLARPAITPLGRTAIAQPPVAWTSRVGLASCSLQAASLLPALLGTAPAEITGRMGSLRCSRPPLNSTGRAKNCKCLCVLVLLQIGRRSKALLETE